MVDLHAMPSLDQPTHRIPKKLQAWSVAVLANGMALLARHTLIAIVCAGFGLRLFWCLKYPAYNSPDAVLYLQEADNVFAAGGIESVKCMPLYPILLHFAGADGIIALQLLLSTASIYLGYRIACDVWSRKAGLIAALLMAVHPMLIYYTTFRLTETVFIFLALLGILAIYRNQIAVAAIAFTLANLARPSLDLVLPAMILAGTFATIAKPTLREIARRLGILALIYCTLMSPWWLHNFRKYHQFVRLDLGAGITMLLENNQQFELYGMDWSKLTPWVPFAQITDPVEQDEAMQSAALHYIRTRPLNWLRGDADRIRRFFTPSDVTYNRLQTFTSAIVLILTLVGALTTLIYAPGWRRRAPLWIPIAFLAALHLSFHALPRYRLPIDPLLIILASGGLLIARSAARDRWPQASLAIKRLRLSRRPAEDRTTS
jgi:4-amino-4-deoxy-L-arabinose transferase-like glycosyltransferase